MRLSSDFIRLFLKKARLWLAALNFPEPTYLLIVALLIGLGTGYAAVGFRTLIDFFQVSFFSGGHKLLSFLGDYYVVFIPAAGGALVGPMIYFLAREAKGHGVPEVMGAVAEKGGVIRPRIVVIKALASSISIGSGGSVGREGPIVQIGSAIGSTIGQLLKFSEANLKTLVACGAAGGISATFNAPIGGVLFAQELILGKFTTNNFIMIVVSSIVSAVIGRVHFGDFPSFKAPPYTLIGPHELGFYIILGVMAGLFALLYIKSLYWFEDLFDYRVKAPEYLKPVLGGLLVGLIGIKFPEVFGVGYETVEKSLDNQLLLVPLVALLFLKLLATSVTIGSGGSGGVFAPGLFMGAMLGGAFGKILQLVLPGLSAPPGAYSLVGMGAVFAAMAHAPITAIIMLFEMTNDYRIILPLMTACVIGTLVSSNLFRESIYTLKLWRRGLDIKTRQVPDLLEALTVGQAMTALVTTVPTSSSIEKAEQLVRETGHLGYPVTATDATLYGIITWNDILRATRAGRGKEPVVSICSRRIVKTWPDESLKIAAEKLASNNIGRLPVVESEKSDRLVGIISRSDIINQYRIRSG